MDFSKYRFRASQCHLLMVGTIGLTDKEKTRLKYLINRKMDAVEGVGKGLTPNMEEEILVLRQKNKSKELPKTMKNELRKIWRSEKHKRNFLFTNKYVQKGLQQEDEAITIYMLFRNKIKKVLTLFTKNEDRFSNDWFTGTPDIVPMKIESKKVGFDTKCSWGLDTFPFEEDKLIDAYECQNQVYMDLTGADEWITASCLVNASEHMVNNEKLKWLYALQNKNGNPDNEEHPNYDEYIQKCREIEIMMIFDYDRFVELYPYHDMVITRRCWFSKSYDIPLAEKVIEKTSFYNHDKINELKKRITIAREYLNNLK